jgi:hypothetical protein
VRVQGPGRVVGRGIPLGVGRQRVEDEGGGPLELGFDGFRGRRDAEEGDAGQGRKVGQVDGGVALEGCGVWGWRERVCFL